MAAVVQYTEVHQPKRTQSQTRAVTAVAVLQTVQLGAGLLIARFRKPVQRRLRKGVKLSDDCSAAVGLKNPTWLVLTE